MIEFSLEKPQGGVQFVLPPDGATGEAMVSHLVLLVLWAHQVVHIYNMVHGSSLILLCRIFSNMLMCSPMAGRTLPG